MRWSAAHKEQQHGQCPQGGGPHLGHPLQHAVCAPCVCACVRALAGPRIRPGHHRTSFLHLARHSQYPMAVLPDAKGMVPEDDPTFIGMYWGAVSPCVCKVGVDVHVCVWGGGGRGRQCSGRVPAWVARASGRCVPCIARSTAQPPFSLHFVWLRTVPHCAHFPSTAATGQRALAPSGQLQQHCRHGSCCRAAPGRHHMSAIVDPATTASVQGTPAARKPAGCSLFMPRAA